MALYGVKHIPANYNDPFGSAGLFSQLLDNVNGSRPILTYDLEGGDLTEDKLKAILDEVMPTGNPDTIWCSGKLKKVFDAFIKSDTSHIITVERGERTAGTGIDYYEYNGARLHIRVDADFPDDKFVIVNMSKCRKGWLENDTLITKDEPALSSREFRKSIQGSIGFIIEDVGYEHIIVTNVGGGKTERVYKTYETNPAAQSTGSGKEAEKVSADPEAASADNIGQVIIVETGWSNGTNIATATAGEVYMSNGTAWVKLS